jgi:hypothetical protein
MLQHYATREWNHHFSESTQQEAINQLENGHILCLPELRFEVLPEEAQFFSGHYVDPTAKHVGYQSTQHRLWGVQELTDQQHSQLKKMLERFARSSYTLVQHLLAPYTVHLVIGRTSFRPIEIDGRKTSYRKDDKLLHVDAFPSAPNQGNRILRVFSNINPHNEDRIWRIGEPFEQVAERFLPHLPEPLPGSRALLRALKITKSYRTLYDHYMLRMHNVMKKDQHYQQTASQQTVRFAAGSAWIVQTDHVSHAAMKGRYVLEQTFYLPVKAMLDECRSPLRVLERRLGKALA